MSSWASRLRGGNISVRLSKRAQRELQGALTRFVLGTARPLSGFAAVATLNSDEENASVTTVLLANGLDPLTSVAQGTPAPLGSASLLTSDTGRDRIVHISPDPAAGRAAIEAAAKRLDLDAGLSRIRFVPLRFWPLLRAYRDASTTFSTHVLLPGTDPSNRRIHVHLTHGSGPKPDTTFRGPTTVLASITPQWVPSQLQEYKLAVGTHVVSAMPRLEVMRRAIGDRSVPKKLGLDPARRFVVWSPTYRAIRKAGGEIRVTGLTFSERLEVLRTCDGLNILDVIDHFKKAGWQLIAKIHPHDIDDFSSLGVPIFSNDDLQKIGITPYELFGAADLLITDYSSVFTERSELGLDYALFCPDLKEFAASARSFRAPRFTKLTTRFLSTPKDLVLLTKQGPLSGR